MFKTAGEGREAGEDLVVFLFIEGLSGDIFVVVFFSAPHKCTHAFNSEIEEHMSFEKLEKDGFDFFWTLATLEITDYVDIIFVESLDYFFPMEHGNKNDLISFFRRRGRLRTRLAKEWHVVADPQIIANATAAGSYDSNLLAA